MLVDIPADATDHAGSAKSSHCIFTAAGITFKVLKHLEQVARDEIKPERLVGNPKLEQFMELIHCPDFHSPNCAA